MSRTFVVGAGLAGLSAAVALSGRGRAVTVIEASGQAGGRCRSFLDPVLGMTLDNGNHFILSGNHATFAYLRAIGAADRLIGPATAALDFYDARSRTRWRIRPNDGAIPWWLLSRDRRTPGTSLGEHLRLAPLVGAARGRRIDAVLDCEGPLWERLIAPFLLGALNSEPGEASARLAGAVLRQSLARGGRAYRVRIAHPTLAAAFVDPAIARLEAAGATVRLGQPVRRLRFEGDRVVALDLADAAQALGASDTLVLATPPWITPALAPGVTAPDRFNPIVNAHFKLEPPPGASPMLGVIGGTAEWIFAFADRLSVTVSAANRIVDQDRDTLARTLWADIAAVYDLPREPPPHRIVKERRATFAATPEQDARRPPARTRWRNLFLAGDWIDTGLPATIEGAVRSGSAAAALALEFTGAS